jgi:hypothetical protein
MAYFAIATVMYVSMHQVTKYGQQSAENATSISEIEATSQDSIASRAINHIKNLGQGPTSVEAQAPAVESLPDIAQPTAEIPAQPTETEPKKTPSPSEVKEIIANESRSQSEKEAKAYIFQHESGFNQYAINPSSGACGLGQRLNCQLLINDCPDWKTNYDCQDEHFTKYMQRRYGSWNNAMAFWKTNRWW